ncbi:hypothetical protein Gorai_008458, partial [Gossypium raimondii]|nr:hypothetical protein [Gossypium raimondii]
MQGFLNSTMDKLKVRDDTLEATMTTLKKQVEELKKELIVYKVTLGNGMLASELKINVPKLKEFKRKRSTRDVDNSLWRMEQYFFTMRIEKDATKVNN